MFKINVGFTKKVGEPNYGSRGAAVHLELELADECDAERLKDRIRQLFVQAKASVQEELALVTDGRTGDGPGLRRPAPARDRTRPATAAQIRALGRVADRWQVDLSQWLYERFGTGDPTELSITEASELIDELRGTSSASVSRR